MADRRAEYVKYLASPWWFARRQRRLLSAGNQCEWKRVVYDHPAEGTLYGDRCTVTARLEVHHKTYATLGREADDDLDVLCNAHHIASHLASASCKLCGEPAFYWESDVQDCVDGLIETHGTDFNMDDASWCLPENCGNCGQDWGWKL